MTEQEPAKRDRFALRLTDSERDRVIAHWIDRQMARGFDVSAQIKDILYEVITGTSALTGQALSGRAAEPTGEIEELSRYDPDDPVIQKFSRFAD